MVKINRLALLARMFMVKDQGAAKTNLGHGNT
jgi:hypothetical protein